MTPGSDTVIYEAHVKGMTALHPDVAPPLRGTFAGLADPHVVDHLVRLGVTAIELLPVHAFFDDRHLVQQGLRNYWGYNTTRSEEHTSELQSLMRISYAVFCLKKKKK